MNINNYDFYGNYNEENDYTFSVYEIHKKQEQKENRRLNLYKKIINRCFNRIKLAVENEELFCFYQLPEYIPGAPIYNMTDCLFFIINELTSKGFQCKYCYPLLIYITWPQKKKNLRLKNKKNIQQSRIRKLEEDMNLNYRSISDYKPSGNFLCNQKKTKTLFF